MKMTRMNITRHIKAQNVDASLAENLLNNHYSHILHRCDQLYLVKRTLRELSSVAYEGKLKIDNF